jgi:acyl dehydratase
VAAPTASPPIGRAWPAVDYEVGREKLREYVAVTGESSPLCSDREAARAAGYRDLVAPPMFAVVYCAPSIGPAVVDPEVGIDLAMVVHGAQAFTWAEPVCVGDTITTTTALTSVQERRALRFYAFETVSANQHGAEVSRGTWTNIVRPR